MHKLIALKRLRYPRGVVGVEYEPGDKFEALSDRDAKALTLVRAAQADDKPDEPSARTRARAAPAPAPAPARAPAPAPAPAAPPPAQGLMRARLETVRRDLVLTKNTADASLQRLDAVLAMLGGE